MMKKIAAILLIISVVCIGAGVWFYLNPSPVLFDITLVNGDKMTITYEEFDNEYIMKNKLRMFYGAEFSFEDRVKSVEDNKIETEPDNYEDGSFIRFESGMTLFVSKIDDEKYNEKMKLLKEGKKVKVTTYFTEKSNRGSFPIPTLMPYMDFENLDYDYSKLIIE